MIIDFIKLYEQKQGISPEVVASISENISQNTIDLMKSFINNPNNFLAYRILLSMQSDGAIKLDNLDALQASLLLDVPLSPKEEIQEPIEPSHQKNRSLKSNQNNKNIRH